MKTFLDQDFHMYCYTQTASSADGFYWFAFDLLGFLGFQFLSFTSAIIVKAVKQNDFLQPWEM